MKAGVAAAAIFVSVLVPDTVCFSPSGGAMMLRSTRGLGAARALANSGLGARRAGALRSTFGAPLSPMMTAESAEPDMVWRQGYYETLADGAVWRRGAYAARGASFTPPARAVSCSANPPTPLPVVEAADSSKTEAEEDCGCGEAMSLDDIKVNIKLDIEKVGETIRALKSEGVKDKTLLQPHIDELLALKAKWQSVTGQPYDPPKPGAKPKKEATKKEAAPAAKGGKGGGKAEDGDFKITPRAEDYSKWYQDVISAAQMVDQSPVKGCMVIRPWGMAVWDELKDDLNRRIKAKGVQNAYFPLLIPISFLSKEAEHVEGFAKECAVVTHHRLTANPDGPGLIPDPAAKLEEPLIVRPTSETIIWDMFGKWISSYRDLPLKINQWANVVRWELRTRPFLRSAEFLWQEGHTAHASKDEADAHAREMLDVYADVAREVLGVPVIRGCKSPSERFAGADETYTIEALMQNGWALQSGTSHFLGQNFARAFDVQFQTKDQTSELVWATSWGVSTRLLGALVMTHSDDSGLVLPPRVAPHQVVIVPVGRGKAENNAKVDAFLEKLSADLHKTDIRFHIDNRDMMPGAKFYDWERKGVPLRIELGPRDVDAGQLVLSARIESEKTTMAYDSATAASCILDKLNSIQDQMLAAAEARLTSMTRPCESYEEMKAAFLTSTESNQGQGLWLVPWKCDAENEDLIKVETRATIRCYPFEHNQEPPTGKKCFYSGEPATHMALFARAY